MLYRVAGVDLSTLRLRRVDVDPAVDVPVTVEPFTEERGSTTFYLARVVLSGPLALGEYELDVGECLLPPTDAAGTFHYEVVPARPLPDPIGTVEIGALLRGTGFEGDLQWSAPVHFEPHPDARAWLSVALVQFVATTSDETVWLGSSSYDREINVRCDGRPRVMSVAPGPVDVVFEARSYFGGAPRVARISGTLDCETAVDLDAGVPTEPDGAVVADAGVVDGGVATRTADGCSCSVPGPTRPARGGVWLGFAAIAAFTFVRSRARTARR